MRKTYLHSIYMTALVVILVLSCLPSGLVRAASASDSHENLLPPLISEVQTTGLKADGTEEGRTEIIELYNPNDTVLPLDGLQVEYLTATHTGTAAPTRVIANLQGASILPKFYFLLSHDPSSQSEVEIIYGGTDQVGMLARSGGHVRLFDTRQQTTIDLVSWGSATHIGNWWHAPVIPAGTSIQRILPGEPSYTTGREFTAPDLPTPRAPRVIPPEASPPPRCDGIILSELLPNPGGSDASHEFIEIYNPTAQPVALESCRLRLGEDGPLFVFPQETLAPQTYKAFYDGQSGVVLPNTTAQPVWLLTSSGEQSVLYPDALRDDESWSYIEGEWQISLQPTPGAANQALLPPPPLSEEPEQQAPERVPCAPDQERNPETQRCRKIQTPTTDAGLVPCKEGQERNPVTNRCRVRATINASTPCKAGEARNPETNRCRSVLAASTEPKPCAPGQERNPATGRCRKKAVQQSAHLAQVQDVRPSTGTSSMRWWIIAGTVAAAALGYALYEWRQDIANSLLVCKAKLKRNRS